MKRAFTLVEMLVVVVVITILMSIVFRLSAIVGDRTKRSKTIELMQRTENCLSGYYAAFGSYPPVALTARQNPYCQFDKERNRQDEDAGEAGSLSWGNVEAACRAQPVAARWPYRKGSKGMVDAISKLMMTRAASGDSAYDKPWLRTGFTTFENPNDYPGWSGDSSYWQDCQIFQFGLMSYLLPRYQLMAGELGDNMVNALDDCTQWTANNQRAANQDEGTLFTDWKDEVRNKSRTAAHQRSLMERIPSESVTARWLPNFEGGVVGSTYTLNFFGVTVAHQDTAFTKYALNADNTSIECFQGTGSNWYVLDVATIFDGWGCELFYYSEPPYQGYRLWSAGPDGQTFLPGYPLESLKSRADQKTAASWMADDIVFMSH